MEAKSSQSQCNNKSLRVIKEEERDEKEEKMEDGRCQVRERRKEKGEKGRMEREPVLRTRDMVYVYLSMPPPSRTPGENTNHNVISMPNS